jgi:hypothetical protein
LAAKWNFLFFSVSSKTWLILGWFLEKMAEYSLFPSISRFRRDMPRQSTNFQFSFKKRKGAFINLPGGLPLPPRTALQGFEIDPVEYQFWRRALFTYSSSLGFKSNRLSEFSFKVTITL